MTQITAKVVADSLFKGSPRLTSMELRFPRIILAEFNTHRRFSRNARSSRAVPIATMIKEIEEAPFVPLHWGRNQKGMQADEECNEQVMGIAWNGDPYPSLVSREEAWEQARDNAVEYAKAFADAGYHKQLVNRLLEPFMHVDVLVTSVEWDNFFALRDHPDAEPHIQILARAMKAALDESQPRILVGADWHLPYVLPDERDRHGIEICRQLSVARCARISYAPFDGDAAVERELARYEALVGSEPRHASPAEHQATPDLTHYKGGYEHPELHGNLTGWRQLRRYLDLGLKP